MLTISKALSATQARTYHAREFTSEKQNYWSRDQQGHSEWQGELARKWGLQGVVRDEHFARLSEGQHHESAAQLVKHQPARTYENEYGKQITSAEHRAGWDATFSAPKSISLTALVGGDERVREAHRESVRVALHELERYTQARIGNIHAPETTGKLVAATFEHDTARPVNGYAAPQLHTHAVIFNVTERGNGQTRALQERSLFQSQQYATSVYRSELAMRLQRLGYEIERGEYGQPDIKGYTREYLDASSLRRAQIKEHLQDIGRDGAGAAQVAAHRTRDGKDLLSREEVLHRHCELAAKFGNQPDQVVSQAREQAQRHRPRIDKTAQQSITYSRNHVFERSAVQDERTILQAAIDRSMGEATYNQVRQEFEQRVIRGEFRRVERMDGRAGPQYTTAEMVRLEREIVGSMQQGNLRGFENSMLVSPPLRIRIEDQHPELSKAQLGAVDEIFLSREKIIGLDGVAGAGKTTTLAVIREGVEAQGYVVEGFAPTSRAAQKLSEVGMKTSTLQHHLVRGEQLDTGEKRLFVLDESSLASTRQMHEFVTRLHRNDRVLLVGDTRQHEAVEAGRPFAQLQDAGMRTVKLDEIVRQRDPELKQAVEQLARGQVRAAVESLDRQGRVHEVRERGDRIATIAREYASSPESTLVVSPDNRSRSEINQQIHKELQSRGAISKQENSMQMLVPRQEMTGADRSWAQQYQVDDILRYSRASKETGIGKGEYARVIAVHPQENTLTVLRANGEQTTYDPHRQMGVSVYRKQEKVFSIGDRVQFTAPNQELKIANRELGMVENIAQDGTMWLKLDVGRSVNFDSQRFPHLDHGYAMTSYSSQGQTAERVLIHVDTELGAKDLLNNRMAYVSISRSQWDAQIFTNDKDKLSQVLSRDVSHQSAYKPEQAIVSMQQKVAPSPAYGLEQGIGLGLGI
ncbi:MobF family relaxase [Acidobacterium sp. S8]|uniref:MobF family relaxase n=1 Tax=Acidobacterium sp. S8 TaxID=1641854 RepID=UPI00131D143E|nr:MobF family relaxase [Acidobacterium sp. S8]